MGVVLADDATLDSTAQLSSAQLTCSLCQNSASVTLDGYAMDYNFRLKGACWGEIRTGACLWLRYIRYVGTYRYTVGKVSGTVGPLRPQLLLHDAVYE